MLSVCLRLALQSCCLDGCGCWQDPDGDGTVSYAEFHSWYDRKVESEQVYRKGGLRRKAAAVAPSEPEPEPEQQRGGSDLRVRFHIIRNARI